jgi:N-acetylglutamate synthase-like GNAT family acetyltransferase
MSALDSRLRSQLDDVCQKARDKAEEAARSALQKRAVDAAEPHSHFTPLEKKLRNRVLRMPLGLHLSEQDVRDEEQQVHLVAMNGEGRVIGCVLVAFSGNIAKVRQLAIEGAYRGRGIGAELMKRAEQAVLARNIRTVTLHGRATERGFFEKLGYTAASEVFTEVTIPHIAMQKDLTGG